MAITYGVVLTIPVRITRILYEPYPPASAINNLYCYAGYMQVQRDGRAYSHTGCMPYDIPSNDTQARLTNPGRL